MDDNDQARRDALAAKLRDCIKLADDCALHVVAAHLDTALTVLAPHSPVTTTHRPDPPGVLH